MSLSTGNPENGDYLDHFRTMPLSELYSPAVVRERIALMFPNRPDLHELAGARELTTSSPLLADENFSELRKAYERLYELQEEVRVGIRYENGDLTHPMS